MSPNGPTNRRRFRIALSFPGGHRRRVEAIAQHLAARLSRGEILYDQWHDAEFARPNLNVYLPNLYHAESDLIVVFLCPDYERKEWCGLEFRAVLDLIKQRQDDRIMLLRIGDARLPVGLYSGDGYLSIDQSGDDVVAGKILERFARLGGAGQATAQRGDKPWFRCDREEATAKFNELAQAAFANGVTAPVVCIAYGPAAHRPDSLAARLIADLTTLTLKGPCMIGKPIRFVHESSRATQKEVAGRLLNDWSDSSLDPVKFLARLPAAPFHVIHHQIYEEWTPQSADTLRDYLAFWKACGESSMPVFVFVSIVQAMRRKMLLRQEPDPRVSLDISRLKFPLPALVIGADQLKPVSKSHVADLGLVEPGAETDELLTRVFGGDTTLPMHEVEVRLKKYREGKLK